MSTFEVKLQGREEVAEGTMAFHFEKPAAFSFKAGQAIDVILPKPPGGDVQGARHTFSIVTAPFESDLVIATRMRDSAFKRALKSLAMGSAVGIEGPFGSLTLHRDPARPAVFIAGGIGITPFVSMLRQAAKNGLPRKLLLLYSNRRPKDAAFLAELQELARQSENFRLIATMTALSESDTSWAGE
ncbi:MAG TPA: FAD-dependent oxidoreductase, partial [Burkholderiales bacterium]|nr:FAD-dependent oxidoreductase [Burkholderiales bacterium]